MNGLSFVARPTIVGIVHFEEPFAIPRQRTKIVIAPHIRLDNHVPVAR